MHINALFISSLIADSCYVRFDENGNTVPIPLHLATASLVPITPHSELVVSGATWWNLDPTIPDISESFLQACANGVSTVVVAPHHYQQIMALPVDAWKNLEFLILPDTRQALFEAATSWRSQCLVPIVAVTGSLGKTTTVDMLTAIFAVDRLPVLIVPAGISSVAELAIKMLHITSKHLAAVFEVGTMPAGEMRRCADLMRPTIAIITAICPAYLEDSGGLDHIASEKQQIFSYFSPSQVGIVCGDYPMLTSHFYEHPVVRFGLKNKNVVTARKVTFFRDEHGMNKTKLVLRVYDYEREVILSGHHRGLVYGALAASALAHFLYVPFEVMVKGLVAYVPTACGLHQYALRDGRGMLMQDSHSISPESVKASLHAVHESGTLQSRKIAVLGMIPYLGQRTPFWHRHVGRELIKTRSISDIVLVGEDTRPIRAVAPATMNIWLASEWSDVQGQVERLLAPSDNVLLISGAAPLSMNRLVAELV